MLLVKYIRMPQLAAVYYLLVKNLNSTSKHKALQNANHLKDFLRQQCQ